MFSQLLFVISVVALSANAPKQVGAKQGDKQQQQTAPLAPVPEKPASEERQQGRTCPGTSKPDLPCDAVSASADERQAAASESQETTGWLNFGAGVITALIAGLAAAFARQAATAGTKGYQAFVAAEDASLTVEFPNGTEIEHFEKGVQQPSSYHLTALITNIGRSTARVHGCVIRDGESYVPINKTLKKDESVELGWMIDIGPLTIFEFRIAYSTPIRPKAELVMMVCPTKTTGQGMKKIRGGVMRSHIEDQSGRQKRKHFLNSKFRAFLSFMKNA
jgi:hypothetical protein